MNRSPTIAFIVTFVVASLRTSPSPAADPSSGSPYRPLPNIHIAPDRDTRARAIARTPSPLQNMTYHGGLVQHALTAYTIYWDPNGTISVDYMNLVNRYFSDIGGSGFYNINTQYYDNVPGPNTPMRNVSSLGGTWVDSQPYPHAGTPADPLLDADILAEVHRAEIQNGWPAPRVAASGDGVIYFVYTGKGIESCTDTAHTTCTPGIPGPSGYCAYHFWEGGPGSAIYANMPYVETWGTSCRGFSVFPNGNMDADAEISISSHEHFEAATDPYGNAWYDSDSAGEDGDKCAYVYSSADQPGAQGTVEPNGSNILLNGHPYIIQLEWSNADSSPTVPYSGCVSDQTCTARCCGMGQAATVIGLPRTASAEECDQAGQAACAAQAKTLHHVRWNGTPQQWHACAKECCALCENRDAYHQVTQPDDDWVFQHCTDYAADWCAVGSRGGLVDAAWLALKPPVANNGRDLCEPQTVLGKSFVVKDPAPGGDPSLRSIVVVGQEPTSNDAIVGDPVVDGARVEILANGQHPTIQSFTLPPGAAVGGATGWKRLGRPVTGYSYKDTSGTNGPVKALLVKKPRSGTFKLSATVRGALGSGPQPHVRVLPPAPGAEGGMRFTINEGSAYCVRIGGPGGGAVINQPSPSFDKVFKVVANPAQPSTEAGCAVPYVAPSTHVVDLGALGGTLGVASATSGGLVVGAAATAGDAAYHAFVWTSGSGMVDLGTLGGTASGASAVSEGQVVGGSYVAGDTERHAFSWTAASGMVDLGTLGGSDCQALAVGGGQVVGYSYTAGQTYDRAFSWTAAGGMVDLGTLGGGTSSIAVAVSNGQVVGTARTAADIARAFSWTAAGGMVDIGTLGGIWSSAGAVSGGQVVGSSSKTSGTGTPLDYLDRAFSWTAAGGMVDLGTLGGDASVAMAVSDGQVVGWSWTMGDLERHAFSWTAAGGMVDLGTLGGTTSEPRAVNGGQVVGWSYTAGDVEQHAFIWTAAGGMRDLGTLGGTVSVAAAIGDGLIVGYANTATSSEGHPVLFAFGPP